MIKKLSMELEHRVDRLEAELGKLQETLCSMRQTKDWRRTVGAFTDDEGMLQILRDAMRLREADRKQARPKPRRKTQ